MVGGLAAAAGGWAWEIGPGRDGEGERGNLRLGNLRLGNLRLGNLRLAPGTQLYLCDGDLRPVPTR
jgi:hypothetical protein